MKSLPFVLVADLMYLTIILQTPSFDSLKTMQSSYMRLCKAMNL